MHSLINTTFCILIFYKVLILSHFCFITYQESFTKGKRLLKVTNKYFKKVFFHYIIYPKVIKFSWRALWTEYLLFTHLHALSAWLSCADFTTNFYLVKIQARISLPKRVNLCSADRVTWIFYILWVLEIRGFEFSI